MKFKIAQYGLALSLFVSTCFAYTITPIVQNFSPSGKESTQTFQVENASDSAVALEFTITDRTIDKSGAETRVESKDFVVFPLQMTLEANSKRNIRVSYIGAQQIAQEMPHRLIARQLPIRGAKNKSGVNFMLEYIASIYVATPEHQESLPLIRPIGEVKSKDKMHLRLSLSNPGKRHLLMENYFFTLVDGSKTHLVEEKDWIKPPLPNYLPNGQSMIEVALPAGMIGRTSKLTIGKKVK